MPAPIAAVLIPVLSELGYAVIDGFVKSDVASRLAKFALDLVGHGAAGHVALNELLDDIRAKKAAAAENGEVWEPTQEEIDAKMAEIEARGMPDDSYGPIV